MGNTLVQTLPPAKRAGSGIIMRGFSSAKLLDGKRAGIFDVDGVLARTDEAAVLSVVSLLRGNGIPIALEGACNAVGNGNSARSILLSAAPILVNYPAKLEGMALELDALTIASAEPTLIAREMPRLARDMKLGIASNRPHASIVKLLQRLGIAGLFAAVMSITNCPPKPSPDMIIRGLRELSAAPQNAFFVGDKESDRLAGEAAGVKTVIVDVSRGKDGCAEFFRLIGC